MEPAALLDRINALHHTHFALMEKYQDGEQGAFRVSDASGHPWVLKWLPDACNLEWHSGPKRVTDVLRSFDYPVPCYLFLGKLPEGIYSIQSVLPGSPMHAPTPALLHGLFALNELQRGKAQPDWQDFHQIVVRTILAGGEAEGPHTAMQEYSSASAQLLHALVDLVYAYQAEPHSSNDIVHGDFGHANILVEAEQITGVVDWEGSFAGDCSYDLATLLFYSYDVADIRESLWGYALQRASLKLLSIYLADLILRHVCGFLHRQDFATSDRYMTLGQNLFQEITYRTHYSPR